LRQNGGVNVVSTEINSIFANLPSARNNLQSIYLGRHAAKFREVFAE
jgi:hypothetical protein